MDKSTQKRYKYNQRLVNELAKSYGVSASMVRKSLNGDRVSDTAEAIKKDYNKALKAIDELTKVVVNNVINQ